MNRFTRSVLRRRYNHRRPRVLPFGATKSLWIPATADSVGPILFPMNRAERRRKAARARQKSHWTEFL